MAWAVCVVGPAFGRGPPPPPPKPDAAGVDMQGDTKDVDMPQEEGRETIVEHRLAGIGTSAGRAPLAHARPVLAHGSERLAWPLVAGHTLQASLQARFRARR